MNLGEIVNVYSSETFDAELAARIFFSEHSENEVSVKLNELANLQNQIEIVLKQKVRENYGLFMHANSEIHRVGVEMADLKHLLDMTKKMLQEVRGLQHAPDDSRFTRNGAPRQSNVDSIHQQDASVMSSLGHGKLAAGLDTIPSWVRGAPTEIDKMIVEQEFQQAVILIQRATAYLDNVRDIAIGADTEAHARGGQDIYDNFHQEIHTRSMHLAEILRDSLSKLPNSAIWGVEEQTKRLKLLVTLGHSDIAAQGFSSGRKDVIRKALRYVEASGDAEVYTAELSRVFFAHLKDACRSFMELFSHKMANRTGNVISSSELNSSRERKRVPFESTPPVPVVQERTKSGDDDGDMASLSYLIGWIQDQMTVFVTSLSRQIMMGATEYMAKMIEKEASVLRCYHHDVMKRASERLNPAPLSPSIRRSLSRGDSRKTGTRHSTSSLRLSDSGEYSPVGGGRKSSFSFSRKSLAKNRFSQSSRTSLVGSPRGRLSSIGGGDRGSLLIVDQDTSVGPLTFTAQCLQVAFKEARVLDQLGLQGVASLGWHIVPEVKSIINTFADTIIREMEIEVAKDPWSSIKIEEAELRLPSKSNSTASSQGDMSRRMSRRLSSNKSTPPQPTKSSALSLFGQINTDEAEDNLEAEESNIDLDIFASYSYDWAVSIMTYFIGEVWVLLQADSSGGDQYRSDSIRKDHMYAISAGHDDDGDVGRSRSFSSDSGDTKAPSSYSRVDLCEIDPEAVACLLRILVHYIRCVMSVDISQFTFEQRECFRNTIEEICISLLPSAEDVISRGFFSDGSTLVVNTPKAVFATLRKHMEILKRVE